MSFERLAEVVAEVADRKGFLKKLGGATLGAMFVAMGNPKPARGHHCCNLCFEPSLCSNCACTWCWTCCDVAKFRCCECFQPGGCCCNGCQGAKCSYVVNLGSCPPELLPEAA